LKSKIWQFIGLEILAIAAGFVVALVTGMIITPEKAMTLPGGSVTAGFVVGVIPKSLEYKPLGWQILFFVSLALAGLGGWLIYVAIF